MQSQARAGRLDQGKVAADILAEQHKNTMNRDFPLFTNFYRRKNRLWFTILNPEGYRTVTSSALASYKQGRLHKYFQILPLPLHQSETRK